MNVTAPERVHPLAIGAAISILRAPTTYRVHPMTRPRGTTISSLSVLVALLVACEREPAATAFVGARLIDGTGAAPIENAVLVVREGRVESVGPKDSISIPANATLVDVSGKTIMPGMVNAHGHVGDTRGLEAGQYSTENVVRQLALYARYGITTVNSLGGDRADALPARAARDSLTLTYARLYIAGTVIATDDPDSARAMVDANAAMPVDVIKIRVDDNLGTARKMAPAAYRAVIEHAHGRGLLVAAHVYYLSDAMDLLRSGVDFIAHSVRDREVDEDFVALMLERNVCYSPTLMREVSTFVYQSEPAFFADSFFLAEADSGVVAALREPDRQQRVRRDRAAQTYQRQFEVAKRNVKRLRDAGVRIAMGTDTGPPARFQGYFEHLELEMMVEAGLTPMQAIAAATGDAASCLSLHRVGALQQGRWADFLVLRANPLDDVRNTRTIESVWIAGERVPERGR
jgi:imidazolonepropionase-like amidohydrolase